MKKSTLVVFLMLAGFTALLAKGSATPFHIDNIILKNFQVLPTASGAKITWEFASEEKDVVCQLEKSTDGVHFVTLRTMLITSTRQQALHTYTDRSVMGQAFYRLKVSKESYSPFISQIVSVSNAGAGSFNYQQPLTLTNAASLFGDISSQEQVIGVKLVDLRGQARIKSYMKGTDLDRNFKASYRNLPAGLYVLLINDLQNNTILNKCLYKL